MINKRMSKKNNIHKINLNRIIINKMYIKTKKSINKIETIINKSTITTIKIIIIKTYLM